MSFASKIASIAKFSFIINNSCFRKVKDCAAEAIFCCLTENSHRLKSYVTSKEPAFHNEKESRRTWPTCHVSLEKSQKTISLWRNEPNQTSPQASPPPRPAKSDGEYFPWVFHVVIPDPPKLSAVLTHRSGWQKSGERAG